MTRSGRFKLRDGIVAATLTASCLPAVSAALAQAESAGPPVVGIIAARKEPITQTEQFIGRIEAKQRVDVVARVTAFIEKRLFHEGADVREDAPLYRLEKGPFQAAVAAQQAQIAQVEAQLGNACLTTQRARILLGGPAGQQSTYDAALANERALEAQLQAAHAQLDTAKINLGYTEIRAPIAGQIGRTALTIGNVVGPGNMAEQRRIQLGQSSTTLAAVTSGLKAGEPVVAEGLQRVRAGETVSPEPADTTLQNVMRSATAKDGRAILAPPGGPGTGSPANAPHTSGSPSGRR